MPTTGADYANHAYLQIAAAGGYVSPEAEAALSEALRREPDNRLARLLFRHDVRASGSARHDLRAMEPLLQNAPPGDPFAACDPSPDRTGRRRSRGALYPARRAARPVRGRYRGSGEMTADDRTGMIRGMVEGLSDRLASEGGPPEDWARLITALGVLGETDRATAIWTEAQQVFAGSTRGIGRRQRRRRTGRGSQMIHEDMIELRRRPCRAPARLRGSIWATRPSASRCRMRFCRLPRRWRPSAAPSSPRMQRASWISPRPAIWAGWCWACRFNMDGSEGPRCQSTRAFARNLERLTDLPIGFWDERLSTVAAERVLIEADTSRKRRSQVIDHVAAGYILQGVLDRLGHIRAEM